MYVDEVLCPLHSGISTSTVLARQSHMVCVVQTFRKRYLATRVQKYRTFPATLKELYVHIFADWPPFDIITIPRLEENPQTTSGFSSIQRRLFAILQCYKHIQFY